MQMENLAIVRDHHFAPCVSCQGACGTMMAQIATRSFWVVANQFDRKSLEDHDLHAAIHLLLDSERSPSIAEKINRA
jgi:hypothetical protein